MRVLFLGSKRFSIDCLDAFFAMRDCELCGVVTVDDRNDTRSVYETIKQRAQGQAPVYTISTTNELHQLCVEKKPDIVFVCGWYKIIPKHVLDSVPYGFVGFHFSLLPRYRGGAPLVWAMINGESHGGFSLFCIDEGMDTGLLYDQQAVPILENDTIDDVLARTEVAALSCLKECFPLILGGKLAPRAQPAVPASYGAQRTPEDGRIQWAWTQAAVYNWIRAQSHPYPGAFTINEATRIHVWRAEKVSCGPYFGTPGQVVAFEGTDALVLCGDQKLLKLTDVSIDGQTISPKAALKTIRTRLG